MPKMIRPRQRVITAVARPGDVIIPKRRVGLPALNPFAGLVTFGRTGGNWNGYIDTISLGGYVGQASDFLGDFSSHRGNNTVNINGKDVHAGEPVFGNWIEWTLEGFADGGNNRANWSGTLYTHTGPLGIGEYMWQNEDVTLNVSFFYDIANSRLEGNDPPPQPFYWETS